jgi:UDP-N-acetylglucosamine--N-acetylmuramyl-(pentapeptide) pyrophosphoryl-undecaprenol N-acetylglucosamine transferase
MKQAVLIAGGGTGGHLFPGLAVAAALRQMEPSLTLVFVNTGKALESRVLQEAGYALEAIRVQALRGRGLWGRLKSLAALPGAIWSALRIIRRHRPGLVLAVGGYAAFPLGVAAWLKGVPLAVQEQNAVPGLTNQALSRLARAVFTSFPGDLPGLPAGKLRLRGNPVRLELLQEAREVSSKREDPGQVFRLLIVGGSQGAHSLNMAMKEALPLLAQAGRLERLRVIHQTGAKDEEMMRAAYKEAGLEAEAAAFFKDMGKLYGLAHLVVCRAGAGTLTEVLAVGRAAVCVPYPFAAGDHQTANARSLAEAGAALLVPDGEFNGQRAAQIIGEFMDQPRKAFEMENRAVQLARPQAAQDIARDCLDLMREAA